MPCLLDRLTLRPTRHVIDITDGVRVEVDCNGRPIELVLREANKDAADSVELAVCKFVGAGGRAENFAIHPLDRWSNLRGVVCGVNPSGFGSSPGRASLESMVPAGQAAVQYMLKSYPRARLLLAGSSLGAAVALRVAGDLVAEEESRLCGLILRDPPQLYDVIMQRFAWWTGWLPTWLVARRVPRSLDAVAAANDCHSVPALFVSSRSDTVVPPNIQDRVIGAYHGSRQVVPLPHANHSEPICPENIERYEEELAAFQKKVLLP